MARTEIREVKIRRLSFILEREVVGFFEKRATRFGSGAKIDCPKEYLGKRVYVLVCAE
jgi:putative transposon-encoded protein